MEDYPHPINMRELKAFSGAANYCRKFIKWFADIAKLRSVDNKSSKAKEAFKLLKGALS